MKNWYRILILFLVSSSLLTFTAAAQQKNTDQRKNLRDFHFMHII